jgi:hypothetical protein
MYVCWGLRRIREVGVDEEGEDEDDGWPWPLLEKGRAC